MSKVKQQLFGVLAELAKRDRKLGFEAYQAIADMAIPEGVFTLQEITEGLKIDSVTDAQNAAIHYDTDVLLPMPADLRALVCQALLALCQKFNVKPNELWKKVLGNPEFYNKWADERYGNQNIVDPSLTTDETPPMPDVAKEEE